MNLLIVSQYFWPESFIINDLVETLVSQGHTVKVLTGKPNYPEGSIYSGYEQMGCQTEFFNNITPVFRIPSRPRNEGGALNLLLSYISFVINGLRYFPKEEVGEEYDLVFCFCPSPVTTAIPAIYLKWKLNVPLVLWVQDLWPESLRATGFIKNRFLLWLVSLLVKGIYYFSDALLVQSQSFIKPISNYAELSKIKYYPNSYKDSHELKIKELPESLTRAFDENFCVVFAGNFGKAQSLETVIQAADKMRDYKWLKIILVGSGSMSSWLEGQKSELKLDNILLPGRFSFDLMPTIFNRASALLVTLKKDDVFAYTIPSKIQAYMSSGKPIIGTLAGEGANIINKAQAGLTCVPEDSAALADCIMEMYGASPMRRQRMGDSAREYYLEHFEMGRQTKKLMSILKDLKLNMRKKK